MSDLAKFIAVLDAMHTKNWEVEKDGYLNLWPTENREGYHYWFKFDSNGTLEEHGFGL
jgi:hypothetical protein